MASWKTNTGMLSSEEITVRVLFNVYHIWARYFIGHWSLLCLAPYIFDAQCHTQSFRLQTEKYAGSGKTLPTLIKDKEPLWFQILCSSTWGESVHLPPQSKGTTYIPAGCIIINNGVFFYFFMISSTTSLPCSALHLDCQMTHPSAGHSLACV
jgi:hypothetical protein